MSLLKPVCESGSEFQSRITLLKKTCTVLIGSYIGAKEWLGVGVSHRRGRMWLNHASWDQ